MLHKSILKQTLCLLQLLSEILIHRLWESVDWHWSFWTYGRWTNKPEMTEYPPRKPPPFATSTATFKKQNLQRTQSRCCCRGRSIQRTQFQVSSGSQRRTASPCTHLCLRQCDHPLVSRWSWRKTLAATIVCWPEVAKAHTVFTEVEVQIDSGKSRGRSRCSKYKSKKYPSVGHFCAKPTEPHVVLIYSKGFVWAVCERTELGDCWAPFPD